MSASAQQLDKDVTSHIPNARRAPSARLHGQVMLLYARTSPPGYDVPHSLTARSASLSPGPVPRTCRPVSVGPVVPVKPVRPPNHVPCPASAQIACPSRHTPPSLTAERRPARRRASALPLPIRSPSTTRCRCVRARPGHPSTQNGRRRDVALARCAPLSTNIRWSARRKCIAPGTAPPMQHSLGSSSVAAAQPRRPSPRTAISSWICAAQLYPRSRPSSLRVACCDFFFPAPLPASRVVVRPALQTRCIFPYTAHPPAARGCI
ncbi:hypothetical protein HYPSUDRAFT_206548 [Hypholoma sublateritium FD-334 SS-4]|uniref:Uncharacterized protein n=1 Tax=Hypholoma sublateritium (strain FD-334 SS-4) TaxID=945553 RepID=A0A0D2ND03_HYPSF|nr:hypothetical protein HYPSUDRAFT_206548 [Hypholoma sublateritium FD-334 SS-4]